MPVSHYSFWLVPQESDLTYFQGLISALAERFGTVPFCPHVTLYSGPLPSAVDVKNVCAALSSVCPVELQVLGLNHDSRFSKTLYIQLKPTPRLSQLVDCLVAAIPNAQRPILDPHVSLLYHQLDVVTKQALMSTVSLPRTALRFNQVQAVAAPQNFETQAHVASLRCVHSQLLSP
ncbi:MAG: hypothetical protein AAFR24_16265 [Cyanobacteria bacterium J06627_3]